MVLWVGGQWNGTEWDHTKYGYAKVSITKFALGIFEVSIRAAGYARLLATVAPGVPDLCGGSRPMAGETHPNNAQGLGVNQPVSVARSVWLGDRTERPHRIRAPEGWQSSARMALGQELRASDAESY